ncbi:MAG: hypothetical protein ACQEWV_30405 [Bacillota bacterium]
MVLTHFDIWRGTPFSMFRIGTVLYTDYAYEILSEMIGFDRKFFKVEDSYEIALDMMARYKEFAAKFVS